ncbi:MAG: hypothetical protein JXA82_18480 [Sedimentisphaerales bacterium]|nr:hypothetical protein [Sedimentisphaerales bacterium]
MNICLKIFGGGFCFLFPITTAWFSLNYTTLPWIWIGCSFIFVSILLMIISTRRYRCIWFNVAFIFIGFVVLELICFYLYIHTTATLAYNPPLTSFIQSDDRLGYALCKNAQVHVTWMSQDKPLHEATYTTNEHGIRISSPDEIPSNSECILFLGCSITFGSGLNDNETAAYQTGLKTKGHYAVYNFGLFGYGAHQIYTQLNQGIIDQVIGDKTPRFIFYQAIIGHATRASGRAKWDLYGPRYLLDKNGLPILSGKLSEVPLNKKRLNRSVFVKSITDAISRSFIKKHLFNATPSANVKDLELYIALVKAMRRVVKQKYPKCEFHVFFWDLEGSDKHHNEWFMQQIHQLQIPIHCMSDILPGFADDKSLYQVIPPFDKHPNALANEILADYITRYITCKINTP